MQKNGKKNLLFGLIAFFAFGYQVANFSPFYTDCNTVRAAPRGSVILGGHTVGVSINSGGIEVVKVSEFKGEDGKRHNPAALSGIQKGDIIVSVNGEKVSSSKEFLSIINNCASEKIDVTFFRDGKENNVTINAVKSADDGKYHLGIWVNDGINGLGTLTFIDPEKRTFGALGHGVKDAESGKIASGTGSICFANISSVNKSTKKEIGEVRGYFSSSQIGEFDKNTNFGIFGTFKENLGNLNGIVVETASKEEVIKGPAFMFCCIDGNKVERFSVNIEKINENSNDNKSMVVRITDKDLLNRTGGIVQGMSGSPIIQNGKLIGAVTHVFVNDPTRGYGIFIENMLNELKKKE